MKSLSNILVAFVDIDNLNHFFSYSVLMIFQKLIINFEIEY